MILGILSDTHNNQANLEAALEVFRARGVTTLIHCGDVADPELLPRLSGFRVHLVFGNIDFATGEMQAALQRLDPQNTAGEVFSAEFAGASETDPVRVAAAHGHNREQLEALIQSERYAFVFRGHSHRREETQRGATRVINPGALGGLRREERSICLVDLASGQAEFVTIES